MALDLADYEQKAQDAIIAFWAVRAAAARKQEKSGTADQGERSAVTAGKHMDGFLLMIRDIVRANGMPDANICRGQTAAVLPRYFRATKNWDLLVIHRQNLIAAIELKSHIGPSFGNNLNNRAEEAIGSAHDLWLAYREAAFHDQPRPFVGWLILVEDADTSRREVRTRSPHFPVLEVFRKASYLERYNILCQRLMHGRLYTAATVIVADRESAETGRFSELSALTGLKTFVTALAGHVAGEAARLS